MGEAHSAVGGVSARDEEVLGLGPATSTGPGLDLCVNCYERTYRSVLAPGFLPALAAEHVTAFARRTVVVNNVDEPADARARADSLIAAGELDACFFVSEHLAEALRVTGLTARELGRAPYFTDWGIVAATVPGPDWMVHCDPEVRLTEPCDWVGPSIELMERDPRVICANPRWYAPTSSHETLARTTLEWVEGFSLGLGFSDQLFLARRSELARPIYRQRCLASRRYPMANVSLSFEGRIDAWMRHHGRLRANFLGAEYRHPDEIGGAYPNRTPREKLLAVVNPLLVEAVRLSPVKKDCCRAL